MKKLVAILLACFLAAGVFSACEPSGAASGGAQESSGSAGEEGGEDWTEQEITLTFLHGHTDEDVANIVTGAGFRAMVDKFLEEHPNVTLEEQKTTDQETLLLQQAAANNLTDIVQTSYTNISATAGTGQLADITDLVDPSMYIGGLFSSTWDGRIYGLQMKGTEYNFVFYNEDMLKEAGLDAFPTKLEDFLALDEYFDAQGIDLMALGNKNPWFAPAYFLGGLIYESCGAEKANSLVLTDGSVQWSDPDVMEALSWMPKIAATCNADFNQQDDIWAAGWYAQGKAFSYPGGSWVANTLAGFEADYPEVIGATRCAIFPSVSGEKEKTFIMNAEAEGYSINSRWERGTPEFEAGFALISQICSTDYADYCTERGTISAPISNKEVDTSAFPQMTQDFLAVHNAGYPGGYTLQTYVDASIFNVLKADLQVLMDGSATAEQLAANADTAAKTYLTSLG